MVFTRRMAALAAVVLIPLGIAATSFILADSPAPPTAPAKVELHSGSPAPAAPPASAATPTAAPAPTAIPTAAPTATPSKPEPTPSDEIVSRPPVTDRPAGEDDEHDRGGTAPAPADTPDTSGAGAGADDGDDGDDGPGSDG
ncbi:small secreted hydrophilic protein [Streptomyces leeuwenhoekii]|uniref:small secreted hydrophilic protein n=1 Tax=Streptomyces leeuwenhoekii TaxID=1437453 RepID=UPI0036F6C5D4